MLMSEFPVVSVHLPPVLQAYADGRSEVMASGETLGDVLDAVGHTYPALGAHMFCGSGHLADGLRIFLGGQVLNAADLRQPVGAEEVVSLIAVSDVHCTQPTAVAAMPAFERRQSEAPAISIGD